MSTETLNIYDTFRRSLLLGGDDLTAVSYKLALLTNIYTPDQVTDEFWADIVANEVSGVNYVSGGRACNTPTVSMVTGLITFDLSDPFIWIEDPGGFTDAKQAVLYIDTGLTATSRLVAYSDPFALARGNTTDSYAISFGPTGIFTIPR